MTGSISRLLGRFRPRPGPVNVAGIRDQRSPRLRKPLPCDNSVRRLSVRTNGLSLPGSHLTNKTNVTFTPIESPTEKRTWLERLGATRLFALLLLASFVLRISYAGHLYEDDGLWFTAAEEILRGKSLYREIYFDKPPLLPLAYALLFKLFGAHVLVIRLFTILYVAVLSVGLYLFGARFYGKRLGVLAAVTFTFFSTTSGSGHVNGLNTDFLMALPYTAGAFVFITACARAMADARASRGAALQSLAGGALAAIAVQVNPKGLFDLVFFAALAFATPWLFAARREPDPPISHEGRETTEASATTLRDRIKASLWLLSLATAGFVVATLPVAAYLGANHALSDYWRYVWVWGSRYARYHSAYQVLVSSIRFSFGYFVLNSTLLIAGGFFIVNAARRFLGNMRNPNRARAVQAESPDGDRALAIDRALLVWLAVSGVGLALGGRFYSHYFFQILPCLCLISARGLVEVLSAIKRTSRLKQRIVLALLMGGFAITTVRFHTRTVILAVDWIRGRQSQSGSKWYHELRNSEERLAAAAVREMDESAAERLGVEAIRSGGPRDLRPEGSADYLFVWGYRPEVYYWAGLIPASRYLSTQPLTGVAADIQYVNGERTSLLDESETALARAELVRELEETRPNYIIDEVGMFNAALNINSFPETAEFMKSYRSVGARGRLMIYRRRDLKKKNRSG